MQGGIKLLLNGKNFVVSIHTIYYFYPNEKEKRNNF